MEDKECKAVQMDQRVNTGYSQILINLFVLSWGGFSVFYMGQGML